MHDRNAPTGHRILILGPSGSGKTTLARTLAGRLGLPAIQLDAIYHRPGWTAEPAETFIARVMDALDAHPAGWVVEGNYSVVRHLLLPRATTVVWLRMPFWRAYPRVLRRTLRHLVRRRVLYNGNRETLRRTLFSRRSIPFWVLISWRRLQRQLAEAVANVTTADVVILRSPREVEAYLDRFPEAIAAPAREMAAMGEPGA